MDGREYNEPITELVSNIAPTAIYALNELTIPIEGLNAPLRHESVFEKIASQNTGMQNEDNVAERQPLGIFPIGYILLPNFFY